MARTKPPSFDFFPDDFIAGTYHLPAEAVGIYVRLLCYQWNNGSIPSDETELARIAGVDANAMRTHMRTVMLKFIPDGCGGLKNERLEKERMHKFSIIEKAKASADRRWANKKPGNQQNQGDSSSCVGNANAYANGHANAMLPTSNVLLPTSNDLSLSLPAVKNIDLLSKNVVCPEWLVEPFCKWLGFRFARDGVKVDENVQEVWIMKLAKLGKDKALADIEFSLDKQAKNLLDSKNDFDRLTKQQIEGQPGGQGSQRQFGRETNADKARKLLEQIKNGSV